MDFLYDLLRFLGLLDEPTPLRKNIKRNRVYDDFSSDDETPVLGYKEVKRFRWSDIIAINDNHDKDLTHSNDVRNLEVKGSNTTSPPKDSPMRVVPVNLAGLSRNAELNEEEREPTVGSKSEKTQKSSKLHVDLDDSDGNQQDDDVVFVEEVTTPPTGPLEHSHAKDNNAEILSKILEALKPDETIDYQELLQTIATSKKSKTKPVGDGKLIDATSFRLSQKIQVNLLDTIKLDSEINGSSSTQNVPEESTSDSSDSDIEEVLPQSSTSSVKKDLERQLRNRLLELNSRYNKVPKQVSDIISKVRSDQNIVCSPRDDKTDRSEVLLSELGSKYNIKLFTHTCGTLNKPETQKTQENLNDSQRTAIFTPNANSELNEARASSPEAIDDWLAKLDAKYFSKPKPNVQPNAGQSSKPDIAGDWHTKLESKYKTDQLKSQAKLSGAVLEPENISKGNTQLDATKEWLAKLEAEYFSSSQKTQDNLSKARNDSNIVPKLNDEQNDVLIVESKYEKDLPKTQDQLDGVLRKSEIARENSETKEARSYLPAIAQNWLSKLDAEYKTASKNQEDNKARQVLKKASNVNVEPSETRSVKPASIDVWLAELKSRLNAEQRIRQELNDSSRKSEAVLKVGSEKSVARSHISDTARKRLLKLDSKHKTEQPLTQIILDDTYQEVNNLSNGKCEQNKARSFRFNTSEDLMTKLGSLYSKYQQESREKSCSEQKHKKLRGEDRGMEMQSDVNFQLPDLTSEQEELVDRALQPEPDDEMLVEKFNMKIHRRDLQTLSEENWLNDEVINFYMNLIMQRSQERQDLPDVYATNSFFYPKLMQSGQPGLRRWTRKVDIFAYDLFVVPVNIDRHWCLILVDFRTRLIEYLDSRGQPNQECLDALLQYLKDEHLDKKGVPFDDSGWKTECVTGIPQQMNGSDCGMFACTFAEFSSRDAAYSFSQAHMPYLRRKAALEILTGKLLL